MEAVLLSPNQDQSIYRNKQITRNPKNCIYRGFVSRSSENFALSNIHGGGGFLFGSPPSLYSSFPSSVSVFNPRQQHQQPPLLPLPIPRTYSSLAPPRNNKPAVLSFSHSSNRKNKNRNRDQGLTPKKSKSSINSINRDSRSKIGTESGGETTLLITSTNRLGPEPRDIPNEVSRVLKPVVTSSPTNTLEARAASMEGVEVEEEEEFSVSGSIFSLAPPPSSLPLPKFSVTPRLRCSVEAGGIDAGATDNLRRLLRLR